MALILVQSAISAQRKAFGNVSDNFIPEILKFEIDGVQIHARNATETPRNFGQIRDWLKSRSEKEPDCTAKELASKLQGWLQTPLRTKCASTRNAVSAPDVPHWFRQYVEQQNRKEAAMMELLRKNLEKPKQAALRNQTAEEAEAMAEDRRALANQAAQTAVQQSFIEENMSIWEEETKEKLQKDMEEDVKDEMKEELKEEMEEEVKEDLRKEALEAFKDDIKKILEEAFEEDGFQWCEGESWKDNLREAIFNIQELATGKRSTKRRLNEAPHKVMRT